MEDWGNWLLIIMWILGFWAGWRWHRIRWEMHVLKNPQAVRRALDRLEELKSQVEQAASDQPEEIRVERVGTQIYLYQKHTDEFLAQGPDLESALAVVEQRFPNRSFRGLIDREQAEALGITVK